MRALPTFYADHLFRSRTEARYAVFFDAMGEKWAYETEGFDLDGDRYLPDFFLPRLEMYVEIKGIDPTDIEIRKARKLQFFTELDVAIFHGLPGKNNGTLFAWDDTEGGRFTEAVAQWDVIDGSLAVTDDIVLRPGRLSRAIAIATSAQFEFGAELATSKRIASIVDYDHMPF